MSKKGTIFSLSCFILFLTVSCVVFAPISQVSSHAPEYIEVDYNFDTRSFNVYIEHTVDEADQGFHYIKEIRVKRGVVLLKTITLDNITGSGSPLNIGFSLDVFHKDELVVTAICSLGNQHSISYTVWDPTSTTPSPVDSFTFLLTLSSLFTITMASFILRSKYKTKNN